MGSQAHFVVYRLNCAASYRYENSGSRFHCLSRLPGRTRIEAFDDPDDAWDLYARLESEARQKINPFQVGGATLYYQTHLDADRLHDWLLDHDIDPPTQDQKGERGWIAWWEKNVKEWTGDQKNLIWTILDKARFYEVVEEPVKEIVFVIQRVGWEYNDSGYDACSEGGETMRAYRNRERAEGALQEMEQERREGRDEFWGYDLSAKLIRETPLNYLNGLEETYADGSEPIFFEIIEVELEDEE